MKHVDYTPDRERKL